MATGWWGCGLIDKPLELQDRWPTLIELLSSTPVDDRGLAEVLTSPNQCKPGAYVFVRPKTMSDFDSDPGLDSIETCADFEPIAQRATSAGGWDYLVGGEQEVTDLALRPKS